MSRVPLRLLIPANRTGGSARDFYTLQEVRRESRLYVLAEQGSLRAVAVPRGVASMDAARAYMLELDDVFYLWCGPQCSRAYPCPAELTLQ